MNRLFYNKYIYYGVISRNQSQYSGSYYGNKHYGYYGYSHGKSIYEEGKGSYSVIYKMELKKRTSKIYGKREPVLAFANGVENAFSAPGKLGAGSVRPVGVDVSARKPEPPKAEPKPAPKPASKTMTDAEKKTFDMLAEIEKTFKK